MSETEKKEKKPGRWKKIGAAIAGTALVGLWAIWGLQPVAGKVYAVELEDGRFIRIILDDYRREAIEQDTPLGEMQVLNSMPARAYCYIVVEAKVTRDHRNRMIPDIPKLQPHFMVNSLPIKLTYTEKESSYFWAMLLKGGSCAKAAFLSNYIGSSITEFEQLPAGQRDRLLNATALQAWAGRPDINFKDEG